MRFRVFVVLKKNGMHIFGFEGLAVKMNATRAVRAGQARLRKTWNPHAALFVLIGRRYRWR